MSYADIRSKRKAASPLMDNRTSVSTDQIEGQILTVMDVDVISARNGRCGILIFKELPANFYFGGKVLTEMCEDFLADESAHAEMQAGKVRIIIKRARSASSGNEYITFEYVADEE